MTIQNISNSIFQACAENIDNLQKVLEKLKNSKYKELINIFEIEQYGNNPITYACKYCDVSFVKALLNYASIKGFKSRQLTSPLIEACSGGKLDTVRYLLTSSDITEHALINDEVEPGWIPLFYATQMGHLEVVKYLLTSPELKEHANLYYKKKSGLDILSLACEHEHLEVAKFLLLECHFESNQKTLLFLDDMTKETKNRRFFAQEILQIIKSKDLFQSLSEKITPQNKETLRKKI